MKICVTGAGSSRLPLMMASVATSSCLVDEVTLFDINPDRIRALMPVGLSLCRHAGGNVGFRIAETFEDAAEGCDALILTIRPGLEKQRAIDERNCLNLGVLGQETTGPAGFAFAARTIPAVTGYCRMAEKLAPGFLPVIFTNPAGMVTQALHDQGFSNAVGICDSATVIVNKLATRFGIPVERLDFEVSGLNHLSWTRRVTSLSYGRTDSGASSSSDGTDLIGQARSDAEFMAGLVPWAPDGREHTDGLPVEYLYYFLRAEKALKSILEEPMTRGESLVVSNQALFSDIARLDTDSAVIRYAAYLHSRNDTYMSYALGHRHGDSAPASVEKSLAYLAGETGGYADVAMELLASSSEAVPSEGIRLMALNVRNSGVIPELEDDDVVETDCTVGVDGIRPRPHAPMPPNQADLVRQVKKYERLAVRSILESMNRNKTLADTLALEALATHPLVPDRETAKKLAVSLKIVE